MSNFLNFAGNQGVTFKNHGTGGGTSFTLDKAASTNSVLVTIGGVMQATGTDYTVSGVTITTTTSVASGIEVLSWIIHRPGTAPVIQDNSIDSEHYVDGSIDTAHIGDDQVTLAKLASGTDGELITWDASGNPAAVAAGTSGHFLKSQGAGSVPIFAEATGGPTITYHSEVTVSSGTSQTFESFAANPRRIFISFEGIDTGADCDLTVVLRDAGGYETSGYVQRGHGDDTTSLGTQTDGFVVTGSTGMFDANQLVYGF